MSSLRSILLAAVPAVLLASAASAAPIVIGDSVSSGSVKTGSNMYQAGNWGEHEPGFEGYSMAVTTGPAWAVGKTYQFGDVIGDPNIYDADSIIIDRVGTTISFTLKTKFGGTGSA
ncbi:MAG: hypothetical protein SFV21_11605, partial [Rhodospirillaceae bacterium]|nr:hypothetical protein [Rhodospirillaceae bacterium]